MWNESNLGCNRLRRVEKSWRMLTTSNWWFQIVSDGQNLFRNEERHQVEMTIQHHPMVLASCMHASKMASCMHRKWHRACIFDFRLKSMKRSTQCTAGRVGVLRYTVNGVRYTLLIVVKVMKTVTGCQVFCKKNLVCVKFFTRVCQFFCSCVSIFLLVCVNFFAYCIQSRIQ
jgi:hypothetical protein